MKAISKLLVLITSVALSVSAYAAVSGPTGLALDSKGNLYVANFGSNQIEVYNPKHVLLKAKTISLGVSSPMGVGLDPAGGVWVANFANSTLNLYAPNKRLLTSISTGISNPTALAVDGIGNVWVVNGATSIAIFDYAGDAIRSADSSTVLGTPSTIYGIAAFNGNMLFGNNVQLFEMLESFYLANNQSAGVIVTGRIGVAVAYDGLGHMWDVETDGGVYVDQLTRIMTLSYRPSGMAVDSSHKLIYFSNNRANNIDVYTTQGVYVTSIQ